MAQNPTKVIQITSNEEFTAQTGSVPADALTVLYFHAPWAAPCAQMASVLDALASTYEVTEPLSIKFLSINAEELPDVSEDYDVTAVPYIVLQKAGQTVDTVSGSDAATVRGAVEKHASSAGNRLNTNGTNLPPAQKVTRPENQPIAPVASTSTTNSTTKNLASYAPDSNDTPTNPPLTSSKASTQATDDGPAQDLHTRLKELTNAAPVMLFMKGTPSAPQCGFSRQLVGILRENSVRYGFFNILADEEVRQGLKEFADWPTFPQLWMEGELVGGLDIVREEIESNPDFFGDFVASSPKDKTQNSSTAPDSQTRPTATA